MNFNTSTLTLAGVPALAVHQGPREQALARGVVLFIHGLGASKEINTRELEILAGRGLLAVGLDAVGQGARRWPDFDARLAHDNPHWRQELFQIIQATAHEVPAVLDALLALGAPAARLALCGVSQGGFITYRALQLDRRLCAAVALLGSPEWDVPWPDSPHLHPEHVFPTALLSLTAGQDDVVPAEAARRFHERLAPLYAQAPERLRYREFPQSGHMMRGEDWDEALREAADWLARFTG